MKIYQLEYTGDGNDDRDITVSGLDGTNDTFIMIVGENSGLNGAWRFADQSGDVSSELADNKAEEANLIQSVGSGSFQIGSGLEVNRDTYLYQVLVIEDNGEDDFDCGSFTGTGSDHDESVALGGDTPDLVFAKNSTGGESGVFRSSSFTGDNTSMMMAYGFQADYIEELKANAFNVGTSSKVNENGVTIYYAAFKEVSGYFDVGTYTGSGAVASKTGVGFRSDWLTTKGDRSSAPQLHTDAMGDATDLTAHYTSTAPYTGGITSLDADGFSLGSNAHCNKDLEKLISLTSTITGSDTQGFIESLTISLASTLSGTDLQAYKDTESLISLVSTITGTDIQAYKDLETLISLTSTLTGTDIQDYKDLEKLISLTSTITGSDTQGFIESLTISLASTLSGTDLQAYIESLMISMGMTLSAADSLQGTEGGAFALVPRARAFTLVPRDKAFTLVPRIENFTLSPRTKDFTLILQ